MSSAQLHPTWAVHSSRCYVLSSLFITLHLKVWAPSCFLNPPAPKLYWSSVILKPHWIGWDHGPLFHWLFSLEPMQILSSIYLFTHCLPCPLDWPSVAVKDQIIIQPIFITLPPPTEGGIYISVSAFEAWPCDFLGQRDIGWHDISGGLKYTCMVWFPLELLW